MLDPVCCDQALSQKEVEKAALAERVSALQQDLATAAMELQHVQREALSRQEQEKVNSFILSLKGTQRHHKCLRVLFNSRCGNIMLFLHGSVSFCTDLATTHRLCPVPEWRQLFTLSLVTFILFLQLHLA